MMVAWLCFTVKDYYLVSIIRMRRRKWVGLNELVGVNWFGKSVGVRAMVKSPTRKPGVLGHPSPHRDLSSGPPVRGSLPITASLQILPNAPCSGIEISALLAAHFVALFEHSPRE
jgi:hypothetical protein